MAKEYNTWDSNVVPHRSTKLNFAEQTGSGAVMLVWSYPSSNNLELFWYFYLEHESVPASSLPAGGATVRTVSAANEIQDPSTLQRTLTMDHTRSILREYLHHDIQETNDKRWHLCSCLFLACLLGYSNVSAKASPVIGILTQPIFASNHTMIAASYVKWLEAGGDRSIPIPYDASKELVQDLFTQVDGILFLGGGSVLPPSAVYLWKLLH
jgi:hypothetical protein